MSLLSRQSEDQPRQGRGRDALGVSDCRVQSDRAWDVHDRPEAAQGEHFSAGDFLLAKRSLPAPQDPVDGDRRLEPLDEFRSRRRSDGTAHPHVGHSPRGEVRRQGHGVSRRSSRHERQLAIHPSGIGLVRFYRGEAFVIFGPWVASLYNRSNGTN